MLRLLRRSKQDYVTQPFNSKKIPKISKATNSREMAIIRWHLTSCLFSLQFLFAVVGVTFADVSHIVDATTESYPPRPYQFSYEAGRYPGHVDRN